MASQTGKMFLQLKDIIELIAPSDLDLHKKKYVIDYIDQYVIRLVSIEDVESSIITLTIGSTGLLDKKAITEINLLSRDEKIGYARQNGLLPGTKIIIFFASEEPIQVDGSITDLEEDMIEVTLVDDSIIYIDFAYKGIPDTIPIEKIVKKMNTQEAELLELTKASKVVPPKEKGLEEEESKNQGLGDELESIQLQQALDVSVQGVENAQQDVTRYQELDSIVEEEYIGSQESLLEEQEEVEVDNLHKMVLNADLVHFGPDLEDIKHMIELPEDQQRYDITTQVTDMMDDILSLYSLDKRTKQVMNKIHKTIERYKQLREEFSYRNQEGILTIPLPIQDDTKPLMYTLMNNEFTIDWILPLTKVKKVLFNLPFHNIGYYNDVIQSNIDMNVIEYNDIWDEYYNNNGPVQQNKYKTLMNKLSSYLSHIENDLNVIHLYSIDVNQRQPIILNNYLDFKSTTIFNNACETPLEKNIMGEVINFIHNFSFYTTTLTNGQSYKENEDVMKPETVDIDSLMLLPYPYIEHFKCKLPKTSIKERVNLCSKYPSLYKVLHKNSSIYTKTINTDTTYAIPELKHIFEQITVMPPSDTILSIEDKEERYKTYLDKILPTNNEILKLLLAQMGDALSFNEVIKRMEPYNIYERNINNKLFLQIKDVVGKRIKGNKILFRERQKAFQRLIVKNKSKMMNDELIRLVPKDVSDVLTMYYLSKDANESTSEQLLRIVNMDNGDLFNASVLLDIIDLHAVERLDKTIEDKSLELSEKLLKTKTKCSTYVLVKKYTSIEQVEADQKKEIYVDKEYDKTKYRLLDEYSKEYQTMELQEFMSFIMGKLMQKENLTEEDAAKETRYILKGKRLVENGTYAVLLQNDHGFMDTQHNNKLMATQYFKRQNDEWIVDKTIDENVFALTSEEFCNTNDSCTFSNNECTDVSTIKQQHNKQLIDRIVTQMKNEYYLSKDDLEQAFRYNYNDMFRKFKNLQLYRNAELYKYDLMKRNIGIDAAIGDDVIESPYKMLVDKILTEGDLTMKYEYIIEFVSRYTRLPNNDEQLTWFYCKESNVPLLPMFYYKLASTYKNKDIYLTALNQIIVDYGALSDNYIVDKNSGYVISSIDFSTEEGYTVDGFKDVTRDIITEEKKVVIGGETVKDEIPNTEETKMMFNIIYTITSHMSIRMSVKDINMTVIQTNHFFSTSVDTEENYNERMVILKRKGKTVSSYDDYKDFLLLLYTVSILFTIIQTKFTNESIKKSVPGCLKSLSGYPLEIEDTGLKGLTYIACIVHKLKSPIRPWNVIGNMKIPALVKKMKVIIDNDIVESSFLRERRNLFNEMQQKKVNFEDIPIELDVKKWSQFIPPLYNYSIHQPDPIASHVKKDIITNQNGYSIMYFKMVQMCYRIMHTINTVISAEHPHFIGELGPYKDNTCCEELVHEFKSVIHYFSEKKPEILKNISSLEDLSYLLDSVVKSNQTLCIINNLGYPELPDTNVVLFSETVIYKAFMYYCKINKDIPIDDALRTICIDNKSEYEKDDPIEVKIRKMKQEGKLYSIDSLYQLLQVVNSRNIIHVTSNFSDISRYHMLEEILRELDDTNSALIPVEIRESLKSLMDTFDVTIESKTREMSIIARLIKTERKKIEKQLVKLTTRGVTDSKHIKIVNKFLSIIDGEYTTNELSYISYIKRFITDVCVHFPMRILNKPDFSSITIPKHWKITSYNHTMDIIKAIADHYSSFIPFYGNDNIDAILQVVLDQNKDLIRFMDALPYFSSYVDKNQVKYFHVLDEEIIVNIYNFLLIKSLTIYLDNITNVTSTHTGPIEGEDMRVTLARKKTIEQLVNDLVIMYMDQFVKNYEKTEPTYAQILNRTMYAKEKEKIDLVKYMSDMSDEQRNTEQALRSTGQGRWATGLQKGYKEYQGSMYDEETKTIREEGGVIDFTGDFMKTTDLDSAFDEEADAYHMSELMDDDDGEDGDYMVSPIDNE